MAGDGQVSVGETIMKHKAVKVRFMYKDTVLVGFAGAAADAFNLYERLEGKLETTRATSPGRPWSWQRLAYGQDPEKAGSANPRHGPRTHAHHLEARVT